VHLDMGRRAARRVTRLFPAVSQLPEWAGLTVIRGSSWSAATTLGRSSTTSSVNRSWTRVGRGTPGTTLAYWCCSGDEVIGESAGASSATAHRVEAGTDIDDVAEQRALEEGWVHP
jgi:hypothetical protein